MRIISRVRVAGAIGVATLFILATTTLGSSFASARAGDDIARLPDDTGSTDQFAPALNREFQDFNDPARSKLITADGEAPVQVNVVFHVLSGPASEGNVSDAVLDEQTSVLNDAYRSAGIHLNIAEVRRYPNSPYFAGGCFPTTVEGIRMKSELAVDPARFVNIYICKLLLPYIAGYGTLPDEFPESDSRHGIVIDYETLPGSAAPLNLGHTLVHELGHYFGLLHTFQGGCAEPGDGVADTPAEAVPAHGCPVDRDTCPQVGLDPVTNFMDYSDDARMDGFSPLRVDRVISAQPRGFGIRHWSRHDGQLVRSPPKRSWIQHRDTSGQSDARRVVRVCAEWRADLDRRHGTDHGRHRNTSGLPDCWSRRALSPEFRSDSAAKPVVGNARIPIRRLQQRTSELATDSSRLLERLHGRHATYDAGGTDLPVRCGAIGSALRDGAPESTNTKSARCRAAFPSLEAPRGRVLIASRIR